jgi:hypothetical protein
MYDCIVDKSLKVADVLAEKNRKTVEREGKPWTEKPIAKWIKGVD